MVIKALPNVLITSRVDDIMILFPMQIENTVNVSMNKFNYNISIVDIL